MFNIVWDDPSERYYAHGLDRGVLYLEDSTIPWNGLTSVGETADVEAQTIYQDGQIISARYSAGDYSASINALFFPDAFGEYLGLAEVTDGLLVDNQETKSFGFSYRVLIGSGEVGDRFGYQIHLVYNASTALASRSHETNSETPNTESFAFNVICTPVQMPGYRPSAHYIIDTRYADPVALKALEDILYGSDLTPGRLPTTSELQDTLDVGNTIIFTNLGNGFWSARGSNKNVFMTGPGTWRIKNVNGTDDGDGTYTLWDTP